MLTIVGHRIIILLRRQIREDMVIAHTVLVLLKIVISFNAFNFVVKTGSVRIRLCV